MNVRLALLAWIVTGCASASVINASWDGGVGNWSSTPSWVCSGCTFPNNGGGNVYDVTIASGSGDNVTLDVSPTINSLALGSSSGPVSHLTTGASTSLAVTNGVTIAAQGDLEIDNGATLSAASLSNAGQLFTGVTSGANTITISGALTNSTASAVINIGYGGSSDTVNAGTLTNAGSLQIGQKSTLNLTGQAAGVTDVAANSILSLYGTLSAGSNNGLYELNSIEGSLFLNNGQAFTMTPASGTLSVAAGGTLQINDGTNLSISGDLSNSGHIYTNLDTLLNSNANTVSISGNLINNGGGQIFLGYDNAADTVNVSGTLTNGGYIQVNRNASLNLLGQTGGLTDIASGSEIIVYGTLSAGSGNNNGLNGLNTIEGELQVNNGQTLTITPTSGTLSVSGTGVLGVNDGTNLTVAGDLTNSGIIYTNTDNNLNTKANALTVTGNLTNNANAYVFIGYNNNTAGDSVNVDGTLTNNGNIQVNQNSSLNLIGQPNGLTDVAAGSTLVLYGTLSAGSGAGNGLNNLNSIEGQLQVNNGQTITATPAGGTLSVSGTGDLRVNDGSTLTVAGNVSNSGFIYTNTDTLLNTTANTLTITGNLTNNTGSHLDVGYNNSSIGDNVNIDGALTNNGNIQVNQHSSLNLIGQPSGVTDVVAGSTLVLYGTLSAGAGTANGLNSLNSIEGQLQVNNGQTLTATPASGTLSVSGTGDLRVNDGTNLTVAGNVSNSGSIYTNTDTLLNTTANTLGVTGNFTNNAGAHLYVGFDNSSIGDNVNIGGALTNNGNIQVNQHSSLNLIGQPNGVTDVAGGSTLVLYGTLSAGTGTGNGLNSLNSIEGQLQVNNGQTLTATPVSGTLSVGSAGQLRVNDGTSLTIAGDVSNSGTIYTNTDVSLSGAANTLTVTGGLTNNSTGAVYVGYDLSSSGDSIKVQGGLTNNGSVSILNGSLVAGSLTNNNSNPGIQVGGLGTLTVNGTFNNAGLIEGGNNSSGSLIQINGSGTNSGTINTTELVAGNGISGNTFNLTGTLTNTSTGTLNVNGSRDASTIGALNNQGGMVDVGGGATLTVSGALTNSGTMGVTGDLVGDGTLNNTSTGLLQIASGGNASFDGIDNGGTISLLAKAERGSNTLEDSGAFTNESDATLTISGAGDSVSTTELDNGGAVTDDQGLMFVGTGIPPILASGAEYDQDAGGVLDEVFASDSSFGTIGVDGLANLDGTLNVTLPDEFAPTLGTSYAFLNFTSLTGVFSTFNDVIFDGGLETFQLLYNANDAELDVVSATSHSGTSTPEPAAWWLSGLGLALLAIRSVRRARRARLA